ncbi:MAG: DUF2125 domain-containing protein [Pseudomonadota bacterium]
MRISKYALLAGIAIAVFAAWGAYWAVQRAAVAGVAAEASAQWRADGWRAELLEAPATGFPNRLDVDLTDIVVSPPNGAWLWTGDRARARMLTYRQNHLVVEWPNRQTLQINGEVWQVWAKPMLSSLVFENGALARFSWDAPNLKMKSSRQEISIDRAQFHLRAAPSEVGDFDYYISLEGVWGAFPTPDDGGPVRLSGRFSAPNGLLSADGRLTSDIQRISLTEGDPVLARYLFELVGLPGPAPSN